MQAIPLILMAAGTAAQMDASRKQANEQRDVLNRQLERDDKATSHTIDQVQQEGQRFNQADRQQGLQEQEQKIFDQTSADVQGAGGAQVATASDAGNLSDDFIKGRAQRAIDEGTRLTSIAREAAKTRAPSMLQSDDALSRARLASTLQNAFSTNKNLAGATQLDAQGVEQPAYGALGKIATAVGGGMASGGYGKASTAAGAGSGISFGPMRS